MAAARAGEEEAFARRLAERERRAKRLLRARVLDGRLESGRRLTEQRLRLLEEVERASSEERERLLGELAGRPEEADEDGWPREEQRLVEALAVAEAGYAEIAGALSGARELLGEKRASLSRLTLERESALTTAARLERRQEALAGEEARLGAHYEAALAEGEASAGAEGAAVAAEAAAHAALREAVAVCGDGWWRRDCCGAGRRDCRRPSPCAADRAPWPRSGDRPSARRAPRSQRRGRRRTRGGRGLPRHHVARRHRRVRAGVRTRPGGCSRSGVGRPRRPEGRRSLVPPECAQGRRRRSGSPRRAAGQTAPVGGVPRRRAPS